MTADCSPIKWETLTKIIVVISTVIAALTQHWLAARDAPFLPWVSSLAFAATLLAARRFLPQVLCFVLALLYTLPGLIFLSFHHFSSGIPATTCLLGIILSTPRLRTWSLPQRWRFPLVLWALMIALSWPIIFLRELDFAPTLTLGSSLVNNGAETPTTMAAAWIPTIAVTQGSGFLWIDWLFAAFGATQRRRFEQSVVLPLGIGFLLTCLFAFYQVFANIHFLNLPLWVNAGRVPGGMLDANPFGVLAACWGPAFVALASLSQYRRRYAMASIAVAVCWLAVLFSGSRSALIIVALALFPMVRWAGRLTKDSQQRSQVRWGVVGMLLLITLLVMSAPSAMLTPLQRFRDRFPRNPSQWTLSTIAEWQFIERILFARVAARMVQEVSFTGVGVGSFHTLATDYARKYGVGNRLPFDNALNWYLHQFAELGLFGSVGWMAWIIVFVCTLLRPPAPAMAMTPTSLLRWVLVAFGIASLLGVHAQNPEMLFTFWTFTFWLSTILSSSAAAAVPREVGLRWNLWMIILSLGCVYAALQGYVSVQLLRVPYRAAAADWNYTYGFYPWEQLPDGGAFRWTDRKAVTVIPVQGPWLCSTFWVQHPDAAAKPVRVQVWIDGRQAMDLWLQDSRPLRRCLPVPTDKPRIAMTLTVNRTWRPRDYDLGDPRWLGVAVTPWTFIQAPLAGESTS